MLGVRPIHSPSTLTDFMFTRFLPRSADRRALLSRSAPGTPVLDSSPLFALDAGWCEELEDVLFGDPIPNLYSIEHYLAYPLPVKAPRIPLHYHQGFVAHSEKVACVAWYCWDQMWYPRCCAPSIGTSLPASC